MFEAYQKLDNLDTEGLVSYMTNNISYTFGKKIKGIGKTQLKIALYRLLSELVEIHHKFYSVFETGNRVVSETQIIYTKRDDSQTSISGVIFFKMEKGS